MYRKTEKWVVLDPIFLVRFSYNYLRKNESFLSFG